MTVRQALEPPLVAWTKLVAWNGSLIQYEGLAVSKQEVKTWGIGSGLTSIADASNTATVTITAHGLAVGNRVTVAGEAVDTDLNGVYVIVTVPDADSFTITTANVTDATYNTAGLTVSTRAPRSTEPIWSIVQHFYDGTAHVRTAYAGGVSSADKIWNNRATLSYD